MSTFTDRLFEATQHADNYVQFQRRLLEAMRNLVGCDGGHYIAAAGDPGDSAEAIATLPVTTLDHDTACMSTFLAEYERLSPELERLHAVLARGHAVADHQVYGPAERERMRFYQELMNVRGFRSLLICPLVLRGRMLGVATLIRKGDGARRFSSEEVAALERQLPALTLAAAAFHGLHGDPVGRREDAVGAEGGPSSNGMLDRLSPRERQIARLLASSMQIKEIAATFGTSPNTVRKQSIRLYEKLGVSGRTEVALWVQRVGAERFSGEVATTP